MYPGSSDPEAPTPEAAKQLAASLLESDAVEAAYYKPDAGLPG
jgi:hypothetical protein